jgi:DNA-binding transcriptional ArsR family regulator
MKIVPSYVISSKKQLAVLSSGVRQEIADVLSQLKRASVSTLAAALGRPADALYYHLRLLEGAGLVNKAGVARKDGRREVLYSAAGSELRIDYEVVIARGRAHYRAWTVRTQRRRAALDAVARHCRRTDQSGYRGIARR